MKAWFGSVPVEERVKLLQLHEPAFVKLLVLLASKAHALPTRRGRRPSMVKFFIFAESVPALTASSAGASKGRRRLGYVLVYVCMCTDDFYLYAAKERRCAGIYLLLSTPPFPPQKQNPGSIRCSSRRSDSPFV